LISLLIELAADLKLVFQNKLANLLT
jgi:hypothetical protein